METSKKFYSIKEVAKLLAVSKSSLYEKVSQKLIPSKKLGRRILIPATFVEEFANP